MSDSGRPKDHASHIAGLDGALLAAKYSYPPNVLGYCGPGDHQALFDHGVQRVADGGLHQLLRGFEGAYPYLALLAAESGIRDPFDPRVVEAYWLGGPLLQRVSVTTFGEHLRSRFRGRAGVSSWTFMAEAIPLGAKPTHQFHVFGVYPWVGRLRGANEGTALEVLDRCRIRWGQVVGCLGDVVTVRSQPLVFDGSGLTLGDQIEEDVMYGNNGSSMLDPLHEGDWVSLHWHWVCDRLDRRQLATLRATTADQLRLTNQQVAHPPAAMTLAQTTREF